MVSINFTTLVDSRKNETSSDRLVSAVHSGNAGDIIYSLPTVKALGIRHLVLNCYSDRYQQLSLEVARGLVPLLLAQEYIERVTIVSAGLQFQKIEPRCLSVDYNLDLFRNEDYLHLHLIYCHSRAQRVQVDPNDAFLTVPEVQIDTEAHDAVMAITPGYRVLSDDFVRRLALRFANPLLLGIPEQWRAVTGIPGRLHKCRDMLEMASFINHGPLFIGTPSLASAIAEGLKVPRMVDLPRVANAFPIGPLGYVIPNCLDEFLEILRHITLVKQRSNGVGATAANVSVFDAPSGGQELRSRYEVGHQAPSTLAVDSHGGDMVLPIGFVDTPHNGQSVSSKTTFSGWALSEHGVARVAVFVDRRYQSDAELGFDRPDVAKAFPGFDLGGGAGWRVEVDVSTLSLGFHEVVFEAYTYRGGVKDIGTRTINVTE